MAGHWGQIETVGITFAILDCISSAGPAGADVTTIERETSIPRRTVYRHLANAQELGLVEARGNGSGLYRLGNTVGQWVVNQSRQRRFVTLSDDYVTRLARSTGTTVHCTVYDHGSVLTVASAQRHSKDGECPLAIPGTRRPAHATASGKVFLAFNPRLLKSYVIRPLVALTEETITSTAALREEIETIKRHGFAIDEHEFQKGICCVSVPVKAGEEVIGALSMSLPWPAEQPFRPDPKLLDELLVAAKEFAQLIGGNDE